MSLADDALDPVDRLDGLHAPASSGEERSLTALRRRILAREQADIGRNARKPLALGTAESGEDRDFGDLVGAHHERHSVRSHDRRQQRSWARCHAEANRSAHCVGSRGNATSLKPAPEIPPDRCTLRPSMIRRCDERDFEAIHAIVDDAAQAYRDAIPPDCWSEPYMPREELRREIEAGVVFSGCEDAGELAGVMGIQHVQDVTLIRHAYVRTRSQRRGIGAALLASLHMQADRPVLIGTWSAAGWAIRFYEKHGFRLVSPEEKDRLLRRYWAVGERQIETSVVLADSSWH